MKEESNEVNTETNNLNGLKEKKKNTKAKKKTSYQQRFVALCKNNKKRSQEFETELSRVNKLRTCKKVLSFSDVALIGLKKIDKKDVEVLSNDNLSFEERDFIAVENFKTKVGDVNDRDIKSQLIDFVTGNEEALQLFMKSKQEDINKHIQSPD